MGGKNSEGYSDPTASVAIGRVDKQMAREDERRKRMHQRNELVEEWFRAEREGKLTTQQADLFKLKYIMLGIMPGSIQWKEGCVATLKRAIKRLEAEMKNDE